MIDASTHSPIGRRAFMAFGAALSLAPRAALASPLSLPPDGALSFQVFRKGAHLGEHVLNFETTPDGLNIRCDVHLVVKFGPITVLRYTHQATERWRGGRFMELETSTTSNMQHQRVTARRGDGGIMIEPATGAAYLAPAGALPLTHWNRQVMDAPMFNPQDGKFLRQQVTRKGEESVKLADGRSVRAIRYSLTGEVFLDDWYDSGGVWTALRGRVKDGSYLDYLRT